MRLQALSGCVVLIFGSAIFVLTTGLVRAAGCYNVPSNFCQCIGCGSGGGYHAPLVLGPVQCDGFFSCNQRRLPCAPCATCSCWECNGVSERPSTMEGFVTPRPAHPATISPVRTPPQVIRRGQLPADPSGERPLPEEVEAQPTNTLPVPGHQGATPDVVQPPLAEPEKATSLIAPPDAIQTEVQANRYVTPTQAHFDRPIQP